MRIWLSAIPWASKIVLHCNNQALMFSLGSSLKVGILTLSLTLRLALKLFPSASANCCCVFTRRCMAFIKSSGLDGSILGNFSSNVPYSSWLSYISSLLSVIVFAGCLLDEDVMVNVDM